MSDSINRSNSNISFKGAKLTILGPALKEGQMMPSFTLTANDMSDYSSDALKGKVAVVSVLPSLDTPVCSLQTKRFNKEAEKLAGNAVILTVSLDLPFAQARWCGAEGCKSVVTASDFKHRSFGEAFGCFIKEWGLLARAVFVIDRGGKIVHLEYVPDVSSEPQYEPVLAALSALVEK